MKWENPTDIMLSIFYLTYQTQNWYKIGALLITAIFVFCQINRLVDQLFNFNLAGLKPESRSG